MPIHLYTTALQGRCRFTHFETVLFQASRQHYGESNNNNELASPWSIMMARVDYIGAVRDEDLGDAPWMAAFVLVVY